MEIRAGQDWLSRPINNIKINWYWLGFPKQYQYSSNTLNKININIKISWSWFTLPNQYQYFSNDLFNIKININIPPVSYSISIPRSILFQVVIQYQYQDQYFSISLFNINIKINIPTKTYSISLQHQDILILIRIS